MTNFLEEMEPTVQPLREEIMVHLKDRFSSAVNLPWDEVSSEISQLSSSLEMAEGFRISDHQGALFLKFSCFFLALDRIISPHIENRDEWLDFLAAVVKRGGFGEDVDAFLKDRWGLSPDSTPDEAWESFRTGYLQKSREMYGNSWEFEQGMQDEKRFFINIRRCLFADFFLSHGARDLLYLFCVSDYVWGDALEKYNIRFERPTALSEGGDLCRFQLFKT